jgi:poly(A) polymerase
LIQPHCAPLKSAAPELAFPELARLWDVLPEARIAGGAVRDMLAAQPVSDIDLASPLPPDAVMRRLDKAGIRAIPTGLDHGTITALLAGRGFEITTLRRDIETDGRHALVAFTDNWQADAARRDFTINAMSMDRNGRVFDYFTGQADLDAGLVRFVGDAGQRIAEDYLRILRFFRFFARYAKGPPDADAVAAIAARYRGLAIISPERIWSELKRILLAPDPRAAMMLMAETGVLDLILPEGVAAKGSSDPKDRRKSRGGADPARLARLIARAAPADPCLRMAALYAGDTGALADRLRLSEAERTQLADLAIAALPPDAGDSELRRALAETDPAILAARSWLADDGVDRAGLRARLMAMPRPIFPLKGRDALALGAAPGPALGAALAATRDWWLAGGCVASRDSCLVYLAGLLQARPS